jgi:hypothetical protein
VALGYGGQGDLFGVKGNSGVDSSAGVGGLRGKGEAGGGTLGTRGPSNGVVGGEASGEGRGRGHGVVSTDEAGRDGDGRFAFKSVPKPDGAKPAEVQELPPRAGADESGDDFDQAFGGTVKEPAVRDSRDVLSQGDIVTTVLARKDALAACTAKRTPGTSGKIVFKWWVDRQGRVVRVILAPGSESFQGTPMAACFSSVITSMRFPAGLLSEPITFPFRF